MWSMSCGRLASFETIFRNEYVSLFSSTINDEEIKFYIYFWCVNAVCYFSLNLTLEQNKLERMSIASSKFFL
jgi:hypothetical protein